MGTAGMPDPSTIAKQKDAYMKMLDEQVKQGTQVLEAQVKHQKEYLLGQADQQKKQFIMQIDMEVKQQEMALDQQRMEQLMALQQQAAQQKAALEQQAMQLTMGYQQKKAEEEMQKQQYEMEKKQQEMQAKMQQEMAKFQGADQLFNTAPMGTMMPGATGMPGASYAYGPNGELIPKKGFMLNIVCSFPTHNLLWLRIITGHVDHARWVLSGRRRFYSKRDMEHNRNYYRRHLVVHFDLEMSF